MTWLTSVPCWKPWLIQTTFSLRPTILFGNSSDKNVNYYKMFPFLFCKKVMVHLCQPKINRRSIFVGKRWITGCGFHIVNVAKLLKLPHTNKIQYFYAREVIFAVLISNPYPMSPRYVQSIEQVPPWVKSFLPRSG